MKIGIYTLPLRLNYGGILQAWALQTVLKRMGHQVATLDPCPYLYLPFKRKIIAYPNRIIRKMIGQPSELFFEQRLNADYDTKSQYLRQFVKRNISMHEFTELDELKENEFDVLITGSDQVWRPKYNQIYRLTIANGFLDFAEHWNVKRLAYAASFGTEDWEFTPDETERCAKLVKLFSNISVREKSGIELCKKYLQVDATHVLDPTLLLTREDYVSLISKTPSTKHPTGNLLCYILDETVETTALINKVASSKNLTPFRTNFNKRDAAVAEQVQPPVEQWLRNFYDAEFVVTDSFHAVVFSIIFGKPFVVIGNMDRGMSRFESLLSTFNMKEHLIFSAEDYKPAYSYELTPEVFACWDESKIQSLQFLQKAINK